MPRKRVSQNGWVPREAPHQHLLRLADERDAASWERQPLEVEKLALSEMADWGPAEDWTDWADAAR